MQFSVKPKKRISINITSLVDVLFLLLIFFIVSSTFLEQPGMKLDLPESSGVESVKVEGFTIYITADGSLFLNEDPLTMDSLPKALEEIAPRVDEKGLVLKGDEGVRYGIVVKVMDAARNAGIEKLVVATELTGERE
ncbi:biopolymer transporter ExbD [bacterium]|nr:biopolymer transporter ExbD [bacterium]